MLLYKVRIVMLALLTSHTGCYDLKIPVDTGSSILARTSLDSSKMCPVSLFFC